MRLHSVLARLSNHGLSPQPAMTRKTCYGVTERTLRTPSYPLTTTVPPSSYSSPHIACRSKLSSHPCSACMHACAASSGSLPLPAQELGSRSLILALAAVIHWKQALHYRVALAFWMYIRYIIRYVQSGAPAAAVLPSPSSVMMASHVEYHMW